MPPRFKLPTLESFNGLNDPIDHWQQCQTILGLQDVPDDIMHSSFATTLNGSARMWYNHLPPNSMHDFQEFGTKFAAHFMGGRRYSKPSAHLFTIKQKSGESLKSYYHRFNQESLMISDPNDVVAVAAFL